MAQVQSSEKHVDESLEEENDVLKVPMIIETPHDSNRQTATFVENTTVNRISRPITLLSEKSPAKADVLIVQSHESLKNNKNSTNPPTPITN